MVQADCIFLTIVFFAWIDVVKSFVPYVNQRGHSSLFGSQSIYPLVSEAKNPFDIVNKAIGAARSVNNWSPRRPINYIQSITGKYFQKLRLILMNEKLNFPRSVLRSIIPLFVALYILPAHHAAASGGFTSGPPGKSAYTPFQGMCIWAFLFTFMAALHSAESAITKISPWKIQEFADEEGPTSPFATLSNNLTRLLSTIIITTTACSIYRSPILSNNTSTYY